MVYKSVCTDSEAQHLYLCCFSDLFVLIQLSWHLRFHWSVGTSIKWIGRAATLGEPPRINANSAAAGMIEWQLSASPVWWCNDNESRTKQMVSSRSKPGGLPLPAIHTRLPNVSWCHEKQWPNPSTNGQSPGTVDSLQKKDSVIYLLRYSTINLV